MEWHYCVDGKTYGPIDESGLKALARSGGLKRSDHVWNESMGNQWVAASAVPGLFPPPAAVKQTSSPNTSSQQSLVADYRSSMGAPRVRAPRGGGFFLRVLLPAIVLIGAGIMFQRHRTEQESARIEAEEDKKEAWLNTPEGYRTKKVSHKLRLEHIPYFDDSGKSGIYIKGSVLNSGKRDLSDVAVRINSLSQNDPNPGWAGEVNVGPVKAGEYRSIDMRIPYDGEVKWSSLYTIDLVSVRF